jgi:hypothetical protein
MLELSLYRIKFIINEYNDSLMNREGHRKLRRIRALKNERN